MRTVELVYVGPAMSGRGTSLASVLTDVVGEPVEPLGIRADCEYIFRWGVSESETDVVATVSRARSRLVYQDPGARNVDPHVRREIDRLVRADGVIFVIDSQRLASASCREQLLALERDVAHRGSSLSEKPVVFQLNKVDLPSPRSLDWARDHFRTALCDHVESIATRGEGTTEAVQKLLALIASRRTGTQEPASSCPA